jgi:transcriptional regulator with XRE-family HTH domain
MQGMLAIQEQPALMQEMLAPMLGAMNFHKRLRRLRRERDLSYQKIADACGVKWQTVQQWCQDEGSYPKIENLEPLASILETTPWYLLFGVDGTGTMSSEDSGKPSLSEEASDLIECITRLDGLGAAARKFFTLHTGLFLLSFPNGRIEDARAGRHLLDQAEKEAMELVSRRRAREDKNAGTK